MIINGGQHLPQVELEAAVDETVHRGLPPGTPTYLPQGTTDPISPSANTEAGVNTCWLWL